MDRVTVSSLVAGGVSLLSVMQVFRRGQGSTKLRRVSLPSRAAVSCIARSLPSSRIAISSSFDSGNIKVVSAEDAKDIQLEIEKEPFTHGTDKKHHFQWFYFRVSNAKGQPCTFRITNAHEASYPEAWDGYKVAYSYNPSQEEPIWQRIDNTKYTPHKGFGPKELSWDFTPDRESVWFAYFAPYSYERHQSLIAKAAASPKAEAQVLGYTLQGRPIDMIKLGSGEKKVWIICRQHPGESMAEWWAQGFITSLLTANAESKEGGVGSPKSAAKLLEGATVYIVPNMNPDGSINGHLRTNAAGANLNREWCTGWYEGYDAPTLKRSPEVHAVLKEMKSTGVDCFLDVHGDEEIPDNFFAGQQGVPKWNQRHEDLFVLLNWAVMQSTEDWQVGKGYGLGAEDDFKCINSAKGTALLAVASNYVCNEFDCTGATLEMPFKDTTETADRKHGWSPARAQALGASFVDAILKMIPHLRGYPLSAEAKDMIKACKEATKDKGTDWFVEPVGKSSGGIS